MSIINRIEKLETLAGDPSAPPPMLLAPWTPEVEASMHAAFEEMVARYPVDPYTHSEFAAVLEDR